MTAIAHWSSGLIVVFLALVGLTVSNVMTTRHIQRIRSAPNWIERDQSFAAAEQALRRTRQWMFLALWIGSALFTGVASLGSLLGYIGALVVVIRGMKKQLLRLWAETGTRDERDRFSPFVPGEEAKAIQLGYVSYWLFLVIPIGVLWLLPTALLWVALRVHLTQPDHADFQLMRERLGLIVTQHEPDGTTTHIGKQLFGVLDDHERQAWITFDGVRREEAKSTIIVQTAQQLMWFALAVFVGHTTLNDDPLLSTVPVSLFVAAVILHQFGNHHQRQIHRRADAHGVQAVSDRAALGPAFEQVARMQVEPLRVNGRKTPDWWSRMEAIGHEPSEPKPQALSVAPAAKMMTAVTLAMFAAASVIMPLAHAAGPGVEAAAVLGTGRQPSSVWGGMDLAGAVGTLLQEGSPPRALPIDEFDDPELTAEIRSLSARLQLVCLRASFAEAIESQGGAVLMPVCR